MALLFALVAFAGLAAVVAAAVHGKLRWEAATRDLCRQLEAARAPASPSNYAARELTGLPAPVQRYFRAVLREGQPMISAVTVDHTGTFNMGETGDRWKHFTSTQLVVAQRPGFVCDGRVALLPGLPVHVHDTYVAGAGRLHATVFGLITVADIRGGDEIAAGELMRFFAEAAWYPTALLPSQGVRWEAVDDHSARGSLTEGRTTVSLLFRFNGDGLIYSVRSEERGRALGGKVIPTPWEGRWWGYDMREGMKVPLTGEVSRLLPEGPKPYWRGGVTRLKYEFAQCSAPNRRPQRAAPKLRAVSNFPTGEKQS